MYSSGEPDETKCIKLHLLLPSTDDGKVEAVNMMDFGWELSSSCAVARERFDEINANFNSRQEHRTAGEGKKEYLRLPRIG